MIKMKIHPAGYRIISCSLLILLIINISSYILFSLPPKVNILIILISIILLMFLLFFFRKPTRNNSPEANTVYAPADGRVIVVEEIFEKEYFNDRRIQVSVFMSIWDVHINWYPVTGKIIYTKYHQGKYLVAWHPKSSEKNERNTIVLESGNNIQILVRQIAGTVARRILSYTHKGQSVAHGDELGFIRFGSRLDVLLPVGTKILVKPGDKVHGKTTPIAKFI